MGKSCEERIKDFIKKEYCDIEATKLPKMVGALPAEERLINSRQMKELIKKAEKTFGKKFAEFLEMNFAKTSVPQGKRMLRFFWLTFDNWDFLIRYWKNYGQESPPETPNPDYFTD